MMNGTETEFDGKTLIDSIPMRYHRRGGRKRIVAPDGSAIVPATEPPARGDAGPGAGADIATG